MRCGADGETVLDTMGHASIATTSPLSARPAQEIRRRLPRDVRDTQRLIQVGPKVFDRLDADTQS
jgi:hypothetical protein